MIVDKKGKLFGLINLIDLLIIVFFISILPIFYLGRKILIKKQAYKEALAVEFEKFINVTFDCNFLKINPEDINKIALGDISKDNSGNIIGEIVYLGKITNFINEYNIGKTDKILRPDEKLKNVEVRIQLKLGALKDKLYFGNSEILLGQYYLFKTDKYVIVFTILGESKVEEN